MCLETERDDVKEEDEVDNNNKLFFINRNKCLIGEGYIMICHPVRLAMMSAAAEKCQKLLLSSSRRSFWM